MTPEKAKEILKIGQLYMLNTTYNKYGPYILLEFDESGPHFLDGEYLEKFHLPFTYLDNYTIKLIADSV